MKIRTLCLLGGLLASAMFLTACRRDAATPAPAITTAAELIAALEKAGADIEETALSGNPIFGVPVRALQVDRAVVHVYEYGRREEREAVSQGMSLDGRAINGTPVAWSTRPNVWATGRLIVVYPGTDGGMILLLSGLLGDPLTMPPSSLDAPYPPAIPAAIGFLAGELKVDPGIVDVEGFDAVDWPDTCLNYPEPSEICGEEEVPGWKIFLTVDGQRYVVHTDSVGLDIRYQRQD